MILTGLVSVTFRELSPSEIIDLVVEAGLDGIEWGGDVHVPHGDIKRAKEVCKMTRDMGLIIPSYGSYYRTAWDHSQNPPFETILETALALETPCIRVWAGNIASSDADELWWEKVIEDSRRIACMADREGVNVAFEYHGGTLTDTNDSAIKLIKRVGHSNIKSYWQPPIDQNINERTEGLSRILPYLAHIHVFHWEGTKRLPLIMGFNEWRKYLNIVKGAGKECFAMLEFVKGDAPGQFLEDAKALKKLICST